MSINYLVKGANVGIHAAATVQFAALHYSTHMEPHGGEQDHNM